MSEPLPDRASDRASDRSTVVADERAPVLRVRGLGASLRESGAERVILADVTFDLARGEALGIVGGSGAGKSTLALALLGLLPRGITRAQSASIVCGTEELSTMTEPQLRSVRGRRIALVHQEPLLALNPAMTIGEQLIEAIRAHKLADSAGATARAMATNALERVGIPDASAAMSRYPHEFSGGMRQRALIAAAVVLQPDVLVADEPTTALDVTLQAQVLNLLDELRRETGMGLLLISHDLDVIAERCARALVLDGGRVVESGDVGQILQQPISAAGQRLAAAHRRPDAVRRVQEARTAPLLEVEKLVVRYPAARRGALLKVSDPVNAVRGVSFRIGRGEAFGIVGESGSGKSSLARAVLRLGPLTDGRVRFEGLELSVQNTDQLHRLRRRMQYIPQDAGASLTPHCTVAELVGEVIEVHGLAEGEGVQRRVRALLERLGLPLRAATALPSELSAGERQRVAIARALAVGPELLVCDEPVASVDAVLRASLLDLLLDLQRRDGLGLLLISHDLDAVRRVAERIAVMRDGEFVEVGETAQVLADPQHAYTRALLAAEPTGERRH